MSALIEWIDRKLYPNHTGRWDDQIFRNWILLNVKQSSLVLDLGAGAGVVKEMNFKCIASKVCGIDLDPRVMRNPFLDKGKISDASGIPYGDSVFDVVFADNVVEHLSDPLGVFVDVCRVLKPGGVFLLKTPNKIHYMPTIARLTPHRFHQFINRLRGRNEVDTFPTLYRANTCKEVRRVATMAGFEVTRMERIEGRPEYLRIAWPTYLLGAAYERLVNSTEALAMFRVLLIVEMRKPSHGFGG